VSGSKARPAAHQPVALVVGGVASSLLEFRGPLLDEMVGRGWQVVAAAPEADPETVAALTRRGIGFVRLPLARSGMNPVADLSTLRALFALMRRLKPDIFFGYTVKPASYGLIAARLAGVRRRVVMITGVGYALTDGAGARRWLARLVTTTILRLSLPFAHLAIFQNSDDLELFVRRRLVRSERTAQVSGSGVDLARYVPEPFPVLPVTFLMIARLLVDKGLHEYAEAARIVKRVHPDARFVLVGPVDPSPAAVQPALIEAWVREGIIEFRGELRDVRPEIAACHVYVLPSYREGMPRTVLEAMAMGRPVITTDVPGCRETVVHGWNGCLVPARDAPALADACRRMIGDPAFVRRAGAHSVELCRERFDAGVVGRATFALVEGAANEVARANRRVELGRTPPPVPIPTIIQKGLG
jgi:glycosyltransferase involved in cell wall biosynthesis